MLRPSFFQRNLQLLYSLLLALIIPLLLVLNSYLALSASQRNMDIELRKKALLAEDVLEAGIRPLLSDPRNLEIHALNVAKANDEIRGLDILKREGENFRIIASLKGGTVGTLLPSIPPSMTFAWVEKEAFAEFTLDDSFSSVLSEPNVRATDERFALVTKPVTDFDGEAVGLIAMKFSLAPIDELTASTVIRSYIVLGITILVVLLLIASNSQLFAYAYRFRAIEEVDKMKDEFISIASHELRTPVTGIRGMAELLETGDLGVIPEKAKKAAHSIREAATRLNTLVEDLLNVSRIEQGRITINLKPTEVNSVVHDVIESLWQMASEKGLVIQEQLGQALPSAMVDPDRLREVITNLVSNAVKYTPKGSVTVLTVSEGKMVKIRVSDTGVGISAKDQKALFSKFYRVKRDETREVSGTGLGLWIVKELTTRMKGEIALESIEGRGTDVTVTFPVVK
ncbi:MAG: sensor histidine kinase [Parcubacteria group bacterium]|nr:sensor histidine kinase [Parcubacteria group bacterium]